jgi:hypothetical protein
VKHRWRSLTRPDGHDHIHHPSPGEAFGVWLIGVLWALACLWLGYLGSHWVLPGVLLAGLLALWGWRHVEWLWWFPAVLVVGTMLEPVSPLPLRSRFGPLVYIDLLTLGVVMVSMVRAVGLRLPLLPRTPLDAFVLAMCVIFGLGLVWPGASQRTFGDFKQLVVCIVVFYATATVASRPRGSRWVWIAFPLASALIGLHSIWGLSNDPDGLVLQTEIADHVWGARHGIFVVLMVALPVSVGLTLSAGSVFARLIWSFSALAGAFALVYHLSPAGQAHDFPAWDRTMSLAHFTRSIVACATLMVVARLAWVVRRSRMHEGPRWVAVSFTFGMCGLLELAVPALSGPVTALLAVATGLVAGTLRADRRAMRSGRTIVPAVAEAA